MIRIPAMRLILFLLLLAGTPALTKTTIQPAAQKPSGSQQPAPTDGRVYTARLVAIEKPGEAALERERARGKSSPCQVLWDDEKDAAAACFSKELKVTESNYSAYVKMLGTRLRSGPNALPEIPDTQRLPLEAGEEAWLNARQAVCSARANPLPTKEPPGPRAVAFQLSCSIQLTRNHLEELSMLYFRVTEIGPV